MSLHDQVALITGGSRRVGAQIAERLHRQGMRIIVHCRSSRDEGEALVNKLNAERPQSAYLQQGDLLNHDDLRRLAEDAIAHWGAVDVLVNNASVFYPTPVGKVTLDEWQHLINIHLTAPFFLIQSLAPELKRRRGCIVNITDIHGDRPLKGYSAYSIAKGGLTMLTKSIARELAPEVRCNAVAPGAILWPEAEPYADLHQKIIEKTALKREGAPEDIARAVIYLIRDATYVTGQTIAVDGGRALSQ